MGGPAGLDADGSPDGDFEQLADGGQDSDGVVDIRVISEARKCLRTNPGVRAFFAQAVEDDWPLLLWVISIGDLRRGVDQISHCGDGPQAEALETWLAQLLQDYGDRVLALDGDAAQLWGRLRIPPPSMRSISSLQRSRCCTT